MHENEKKIVELTVKVEKLETLLEVAKLAVDELDDLKKEHKELQDEAERLAVEAIPINQLIKMAPAFAPVALFLGDMLKKEADEERRQSGTAHDAQVEQTRAITALALKAGGVEKVAPTANAAAGNIQAVVGAAIESGESKGSVVGQIMDAVEKAARD